MSLVKKVIEAVTERHGLRRSDPTHAISWLGAQGHLICVAFEPTFETRKAADRAAGKREFLGDCGDPGECSSSGGGMRTPDTRIMIPPAGSHNDQPAIELGQIAEAEVPVLVPCRPGEVLGRDLLPDLARVVEAWGNLPDAIKTGILALVKATEVRGNQG